MIPFNFQISVRGKYFYPSWITYILGNKYWGGGGGGGGGVLFSWARNNEGVLLVREYLEPATPDAFSEFSENIPVAFKTKKVQNILHSSYVKQETHQWGLYQPFGVNVVQLNMKLNMK